MLFLVGCSNPAPVVENGVEVSFLYRAKTVEGELVDANPDEGPLVVIVGAGKLQRAVEERLIGMRLGEEKTITVADAYGPYDPSKTGLLPRSALPDDAKVGDEIQRVEGFPSKIKEFRDEMAVLDLNHPLAGKEIVFDIEIVDIRTPSPGERS